MNVNETLDELERLGSEQNRKIYRRHGVGENLYGVSWENLKKMARRIRTDHDLARELWQSGNYEARILATMIADPKAVDDQTLETWARDLDNYGLSDAFALFVSKTPLARKAAERWMKSDQEWIGSAGWHVLACLCADETIPDAFFDASLKHIEHDIHKQKNRVRYEMNGALIGIGVRNATLQKKAIAVARKIGKVEVDHGETGCKTPDAASYILKAVEYRKKKAK